MPSCRDEPQRHLLRSIHSIHPADTMKRHRTYLARTSFTLWLSCVCAAQTATLVPVVSKPASRTMDLPGEFLPYLSVSLHARVSSYVERVLVDRGSIVKPGQVLIEASAPELKAQ